MEKKDAENLRNQLSELKRSLSKARETEKKLQEERERYLSLVANIPGAVYRCELSPTWKMYYISDAIEEISGFPASDFINEDYRTFSSILHPEDQPLVEKLVHDAVDRHEPFSLEYRINHADGSIRWAYEKGQAVYSDTGNVLWLDGVIFDITESKNIKDEKEKLVYDLEDAIKDIDQLTGMLPICAKCKNVRDDKGYWNEIEDFIQKHSEAMFSHSLCPKCIEDLYGNQEWYKKQKK